MANDFIEYEGSKLFYCKSGKGERVILLFHGFGQDHTAFDSWLGALENYYTLYSFDLFFHGSSEWKSSELLKKSDWENIISLFLQKENISSLTVAGFSLGAKFALAIGESFPKLTKEIILIAPDGVKLNFWYKAATSFSISRVLFKMVVTFPNPFFSFLKVLDYLRLVDRFLFRFTLTQMNTFEKRLKVYNSWTCFRKLRFDKELLAEKINCNGIQVIAVMGKYDKVIPVKRVESFMNSISLSKLYVLEIGHNDLIEQSIFKIKT